MRKKHEKLDVRANYNNVRALFDSHIPPTRARRSQQATVPTYMKHQNLGRVTLIASALLLLSISRSSAQKSVPVRINRWLVVQQVSGEVTYRQRNQTRSAKAGDRLEAVGDGIITGKNASAVLAIDTGIGTISVSEKTQLWVQILEVAPDAGRITRLQVPQGQVRLKLRRFTTRGSRLEIQTPAGLSGVRGTEFGLAVQPNGKTGLATLQGAVVTGAQGSSVRVSKGFQNFTLSGEAPSSPVPLKNDASLEYQWWQEFHRKVRKVRLVGRVDSVNTVTVNDEPQTTDRDGRFTALFFTPSYLKVRVVVTTPLGKTASYDLALQ